MSGSHRADIPRPRHPAVAGSFEFWPALFVTFVGISVFLLEGLSAPAFLRDSHPIITYSYAGMLVLGGAASIVGLLIPHYAKRSRSIRWGRSVEAAGCLLLAVVAAAYTISLLTGRFAHPSSALVIGFIAGHAIAGLVRMAALIKDNMDDVRRLDNQRRIAEVAASYIKG